MRYIANGFPEFSGTAPPAQIVPGNTICVRGGTYTGLYQAIFNGTPNAPITLMSYPGEKAIIDDGTVWPDHNLTPQSDTFIISGSYIIFRDFEVTNSNPNRTDWRLGGIQVSQWSTGAKVINNAIHDTGGGISKNDFAKDVELYGNILWNNGWDDRTTGLQQGGTGHAIYAANRYGFFKADENMMTNTFGFGFHFYSAGTAALNNIEAEGNVSYTNGYWTRLHDSPYATEGRSTTNFLIGHRPVTNFTFKNNFGFHREGRIGMNLDLGYTGSDNVSAVAQNNTLVGGSTAVSHFQSVDFSNNLIASNWNGVVSYTRPHDNPIVQEVIDRNTYYFYPSNCSYVPFTVNIENPDGSTSEYNLSASAWRALGFDVNSTINPCGVRPAGLEVSIRPNTYDSKRAHVIVNNFSKLGAIVLDLSSFLRVGDAFELRNVQDYLGAPVASGIYNGVVLVNMNGLSVATPVGWNNGMMAPAMLTSGPDFAAFVLIKK